MLHDTNLHKVDFKFDETKRLHCHRDQWHHVVETRTTETVTIQSCKTANPTMKITSHMHKGYLQESSKKALFTELLSFGSQ